MTAALAVRYGMSPEGALRALTLAPAEVAGVADRVGSIQPGKDADLVVVTGDPLDLSSRVDEVILEGEVVFQRKKAPAKEAP